MSILENLFRKYMFFVIYSNFYLNYRKGCFGATICRFLSSAEISTALRPFYFSVHPDLFGKYPEQRVCVDERKLCTLV